MSRKLLMILIITGVIVIGGGSYFIFFNNDDSIQTSEEKQLYTCGMHPEIILEEPGNCPICGMNLVPKKSANTASNNSGERKILYYRAPMDPNEIYDEPGKSKMGMDLVPVYEDEGGSSGVVTIDGAVQQSMNVKIDEIKSKSLSTNIITNGIITTDERNEYLVTTKVNGWIEKLYVNYTGQKVKKGQKLIDIYSPELVAAQQELLTAIGYSEAVGESININILESGDALISNTIKKLELLDISKSDIDELIRSKEIKKYMTIYAPIDGTVLMKYVIEGEKIVPGKQLMHIADLSNLWLKADIYESELNKVSLGASAEMRLSYKPSKVYKGKVSFIYPTVDPKTRIVQLRINVPNPNDELKPAMFANVTIKGKDLGEHPVIDETAVLRSGTKSIVILALGEGKFKPLEVQLGAYANGYYQVLDGLKSGDKIVTSSQFMIDSESSLRAAVNLYSSTDKDNDKMSNSKDASSSKNNDEDTLESSDIKAMEDHDMGEHDHASVTNSGSSIVWRGEIDLAAIDTNKDGKVYQDQMDWNVISDSEGRCPICGMKLKEVTIEEAKENLIENGFRVKK
ncbi:MAG: efflux RND transporter periplasmic adaptor subunit [Ignavibacteriae bacterium]|nr:efflux RND transporter periplasmic adaptor subunit [Ignavibacteriota bacterium]NOG99753.1 efflux RND transporter periplasmic adaptor subunit [Ignavibacteriota bacterium]